MKEDDTDMRQRSASRRISAIQLMLGAVIGLVANSLHPHTADPDTVTTLQAIAQNGAWVGIHVAIITAILLLIGGSLGLNHELEAAGSGPTARLGAAAALLGGALACTSTAIDGFAMKPLASAWAGAGQEAGLVLQVATGVKAVDFGIWSLAMLVLFGAAFVCFGVGMIASRRYPAILGWAAVASGAGSAVAALLQIANTGEVQAAETIFLASSMLITVWAFVLGIVMWRDAANATEPGAVAEASRA